MDGLRERLGKRIKHELMRAEFKGDFKEHKKSTLGLKSHHWSNLGVYNMSLKIRYPDEKDDEFYCDLLEYGFTDWFSRAASAPHDRRVFKTISFTPNSVLNKRGTAIHYGNHVVITMVWNSNMPEEKADTFKYQFQEATSRACETHSIPHR